MDENKPDVILDVKGLSCPMPVLRTKKAIDAMSSGQTLRIIATDPAAKSDIPALLNRLGHEIMSTGESDGTVSFLIRKNDRGQ